MHVKILGTGCPACQSMYNTVFQIIDREKMEAEVEYVKDIERILSYIDMVSGEINLFPVH